MLIWVLAPAILFSQGIHHYEGNAFTCHASDFKFGDFNKDGLIDIVVQGFDIKRSDEIKDGAVYMSTGKFEYDIILPTQDDYPFVKKMGYFPKKVAEAKPQTQQEIEDELAAFEASLEN